MHITRSLLITVCLFLPAQVWAQPASDNANIPQPPAGAGKPMAGMGMLVGEVSDRAATIQVRLTATDKLVDRDVPGAWGVVHFQLYENGSNEPLAESLEYALPQRDFLTRAKFSGLKPDTQYECRSRIGLNAKELAAGPSSSFRTHAGASKEAAYKFVVVTGMNYAKFHGDKAIDMVQHQRENNSAVPKPYSGPDKYLGYPALATILKMQPDFFIGTGDNVYYDTPDATRATTPDEMRRKWHEQFIQPRYLDLFAKVPTMWMVDDHDYRIDDADNAGSFLPLPATSFAMMLEQIPYGAYDDPAPKTYRTFRVCKDLQIWLPENRLYRTPNAALDDSSKTVWGAEQKTCPTNH
ncbi:MAG: alkaline phosphatase D family protein [Planctomycetota bacterium]